MVLRNVPSPPLPHSGLRASGPRTANPPPKGEGIIRIAVISFPGTNCEVESLRAIRRNGMEAVSFKWNDDPLLAGRSILRRLVPDPPSFILPQRGRCCSTGEREVDGYFLPGGFSYEDRGRSGMIAAHDPLLDFLRGESERGKVIIGHCNGAQILVESGLIPLDRGLRMALARNQLPDSGFQPSSFFNHWVWIKPTCAKNRCAVSDWEAPNQSAEGATAHESSASGTGVNIMHVPIAHGEGRFTTRDKDLIKELEKNDQIAFRYCNQEGNVSDQYPITPNGSMDAIAGICNPAGNVIALMPHPERTSNGDRYFLSMKRWVEKGIKNLPPPFKGEGWGEGLKSNPLSYSLPSKGERIKEIFIDTVITNNEERSLEQLLKKYLPKIQLKQYRYIRCDDPKEFLSHISNFNPNKEVAHVGRESLPDLQSDICFIRFDEEEACEGICYVCKSVNEDDVKKQEIQEIFANPHASTLSRLH